MKIVISKMLKKYLTSLSFYFFASGVAFLFDISVYVLSWRYLGTNLSSIFAFLVGVSVLFSILRLTREPKYKKKRHGLLVQLFIGLVSLSINLLILNIFDWLFFDLNGGNTKNTITIYYPFFAKFISSSIGFLASSNLTIRFNFDLRQRRK